MIIILITTIITILIITTAILVLTLITRRAVVLSWVAVLCRDMPFAGLQIAFFDVYKGLFAGLEDAGVRARSPPLPPPPSSHCVSHIPAYYYPPSSLSSFALLLTR